MEKYLVKKFETYIEAIKNNEAIQSDLHAADIAEILVELRRNDEEQFFITIDLLPIEQLAEIFLEFPQSIQELLNDKISVTKLSQIVQEQDSDDATDIIQNLEEKDEEKAVAVLENLEDIQKEHISSLKRYEEYQTGAFMQVELFSATLNENIKKALDRLKNLKEQEDLENVQYVYIIDNHDKFIGVIALEDLITINFDQSFADIAHHIENIPFTYDNSHIQECLHLVSKYDLSIVPVLDSFKRLLGRITTDDIYDLLKENATDQIYSLANVNTEEALEDGVVKTTKSRSVWLLVNLFTAIIASLVIGYFAATIHEIVALAILMPIVASMGGIAGTQTLTVTVRQIALGELDYKNYKTFLKKELIVALLNGLLFSIFTTVLAWLWFDEIMLGLIMAMAIFVNLLCAGIFGASIPLILKKFNIDPAIASGVILTTITDVVGFFSFLGLAAWILL